MLSDADFSTLIDPLSMTNDSLFAFGGYSAMSPKDISRGFPIAEDEEYMWHYLYGVGKAFVNFLVFVDVGVGYNIKPVFDDDVRGGEAKDLLEDWLTKIDYQTTLMQYATYRESLGKGCMVLTPTLGEREFFYDEKMGVTGVDVINALSLEEEQLQRAVLDRKGTTPYHQVYTDIDENEHTIVLEPERVIYTTKNPYMKRSVDGVSALAPAINDLRVASLYPYHRGRLANKISSMNRHFTIDTEKLAKMKQGKAILESRLKTDTYMAKMYNLINQQQAGGGDIVSLDWFNSKESSFAGKIPDIGEMEKHTLDMIGVKLETPVHMIAFGKDINRATLEMLSNMFLRRRETGSQKHYIRVSQDISNQYLRMSGYDDGYVKFGFNPFLPEDILTMFDKVSNFVQKAPDTLSVTELRRKIDMPDEIEYGKADEQVMANVSELFGDMSRPAPIEDIDTSKDEPLRQKEITDKVLELYDEYY